MKALVRAAALAALLAAPAAAGALPRVRLRMTGGFSGPALDTCPMKRCLTVYVSPNCGYCWNSIGLFKKLRDALRFKGVASRVIVGDGSPKDLARMAAAFGADTLLDPDKAVLVRAFPTLWVTDKKGVILRSRQGAPEGLEEAVAWASVP